MRGHITLNMLKEGRWMDTASSHLTAPPLPNSADGICASDCRLFMALDDHMAKCDGQLVNENELEMEVVGDGLLLALRDK